MQDLPQTEEGWYKGTIEQKVPIHIINSNVNLKACWEAVLANPFDTAPRLSYIDALIELGQDEKASWLRWHMQRELEWTCCAGTLNGPACPLIDLDNLHYCFACKEVSQFWGLPVAFLGQQRVYTLRNGFLEKINLQFLDQAVMHAHLLAQYGPIQEWKVADRLPFLCNDEEEIPKDLIPLYFWQTCSIGRDGSNSVTEILHHCRQLPERLPHFLLNDRTLKQIKTKPVLQKLRIVPRYPNLHQTLRTPPNSEIASNISGMIEVRYYWKCPEHAKQALSELLTYWTRNVPESDKYKF